MKVLVDALSARFGGLATYVEGVAGAWNAVAPTDELHVVLAEDSPASVVADDTVRVHRIRLGPPLAVRGPLAQSFVLPRLAKKVGADVMLCVIPTVPVRESTVPVSVVVHDLRHQLLPHQFRTSQRLFRNLAYTAAYARAASLICVSERTKRDLLRLHPSVATAPVAVVPHGADHVDGWRRAPRRGHALAFGHYRNKRPGVVLDAWHELEKSGVRPPDLHVVGLDERERAAFAAVARQKGLAERVTTHPFLPNDGFQRLLTSAGLVVFPSDFEGFGLPVLEAMKLGVPVVVGPDQAVAEIAAGHAFTASSFGTSALAAAVQRASGATETELDAARRHADSYTWSTTVRLTRDSLAGAAGEVRRSRRRAPFIKSAPTKPVRASEQRGS